MKSLVVLYSYHHYNTGKVAEVIATVLGAQVKSPDQVDPDDLPGYDLAGFGSGIYGGKHHESLLALVDRLPQADGRKAFIFSTSALTGDAKVARDHGQLREKLQSKGYTILSEFSCKGFNTNSFLALFGGMNKGRPNAEDLRNAEQFASRMKEMV